MAISDHDATVAIDLLQRLLTHANIELGDHTDAPWMAGAHLFMDYDYFEITPEEADLVEGLTKEPS